MTALGCAVGSKPVLNKARARVDSKKPVPIAHAGSRPRTISRRLRVLALVGLTHISLCDFACAQPLFGDELVRVAHGPALVRSVVIEKFRIRLEHTTLQQAIAALGPGRVVQTGDAGDFLARLCYQSADTTDPTYLVLESSEMGGGKYITGFQLFQGKAHLDPNLPCARMPALANSIVIAAGLELGAQRQALLARFGPAQSDSAGFLRYAHEHTWKEPSRSHGSSGSDEEEWTETSVLDLELRADSLVWISASKVTSN